VKLRIGIALALLVFAVTGVAGLFQWQSRQRAREDRLSLWDLPVADVPDVLPGILTQVLEDKKGRVWLVTTGGIVRYEPVSGAWRVFSLTDGLPGNIAISAYEARDGKLWFTFLKSKVASYDPAKDRWNTLSAGESNDDLNVIRKILEDSKGTLWAVTLRGILSLPPGGVSFERVRGSCGEVSGEIFLDRSNNFWIAEPFETLRRCDEHWNRVSEYKLQETASVPSVFQDREGNLWVGTTNGLLILNDKTSQLERISFPGSTEKITNIAEDREGGLWVQTTQGTYRRDPKTREWKSIVRITDSSWRSFGDAANAQGGFWFGGEEGIYRYRNGHIQRFGESQGAPRGAFITASGRQVWATFYDRAARFNDQKERWHPISVRNSFWNIDQISMDVQKNVWVVAVGGAWTLKQESGEWTSPLPFINTSRVFPPMNNYGSTWSVLYRGTRGYRPGGEPWTIEPNSLIANDVIIHEDSKGILWIARAKLLRRCEWTTRTCSPSPLPQKYLLGQVRSIGESPVGILWLGGENAALKLDLTSNEVRSVPLPRGAKGPVLTVHASPRGGVWISTPEALWKSSLDLSSWAKSSGGGGFTTIQDSDDGSLWLLNNSGLAHLDSKRGLQFLSMKDLGAIKDVDSIPSFGEPDESSPPLTLPDASGAVWLRTENGIARQGWARDGVPQRQESLGIANQEVRLATISKIDRNSVALWRTRPTGILRSIAGEPSLPIELPTQYPVSSLVAAPGGGTWVGQVLGGLSLFSPGGTLLRHFQKDLPNSTVLDISQRPGIEEPLAWIATNDGAAEVDRRRVLRTVHLAPGPVDVILALPDGSAWLAFNPLPQALFLPPSLPCRTASFLRRVSVSGEAVGPAVAIPRGEVHDLALDPDGKTVWIGTSAGLYRLKVDGRATGPISAGDQLQESPIRRLIVDPEGTVWMGIDGQGAGSATVIGYKPGDERIRVFGRSKGLPDATTIEALATVPDGNLMAMVGGKLVHGRVFVPPSPLLFWLGAIFISLLAGGGTVRAIVTLSQHQATAASYRPLLETARTFFSAVGRDARVINSRTLLLASGEGQSAMTVRCCLGDLLRVEEVQEAFAALPKPREGETVESYLVFPRDLDPAASRQLDVYRLRDHVVIVPLSLSYLTAKVAEGPDAARQAIDDLHRRYLGKQDLFDMRNALDEARFFFGRRSLLSEIVDTLSRREHVALVGPRKVGKSSVLNLLAQRLDEFPVVFLDLQLYQRSDEAWPSKVLVAILDKYDRWGQTRFGDGWSTNRSEDGVTAGPEFRAALQARRDLQRSLGNDRPLVLLCDEIERIFPRPETLHLLSGDVERFLFLASVLRALGQQGGDRLLSMIIADRLPMFNRVNELGGEGGETNPFYRFFSEVFLGPLEESECAQMLTEIGHAMGLELDSEVIKAIFHDSGGYPSLARLLASAAYQQRGDSARLTLLHYKQGLEQMREETGESDNYFRENLWQAVSGPERRILAFASADEGTSVETLEVPGPAPVLEGVEGSGSTMVVRSQLLDARRLLLATGMLEETVHGYRVRGALFRAWLRENILWADPT
jgi:ligand-binding sensor domain-containing protein